MILLNGSNIKKMFLDETLFDSVSFNVDSNDKIGFIGVNGAGKSTLFKIITGDMDYDEGEIFKNKGLRVGYLDQYSVNGSEKSIWEETLTVFADVIEMENQLDEIRFDIENNNGNIDELVKRQTSLQEAFAERDGFYYKSKVKSTLTGLGFSEDEFDLCVDKLSGGQKTRVALGKILLSDANLLLLDEPTNFLDKEHVTWLAEYLSSLPNAFLVVSHDYDFLEKISTRICDIDNEKITKYFGTYSEFTRKKALLREDYIRQYAAQQKTIKKTEEFIRRNIAGRKSKMARGRQKQLDRMDKMEALEQKEIKPHFRFEALPLTTTEHLRVKHLDVGYHYPVLSDISFSIKGGEKIVMTGFNGIGKSTLLKTLISQIPSLSGSFRFSEQVKIGYFEQELAWADIEKTPIQIVSDAYPSLAIKDVRKRLADCGISSKHAMQEIGTLSGGEQAKVKMCLLMMKPCNFLIMDEPTNHLDALAKESLKTALEEFEGTVLLVSHEEAFYREWTQKVINIEKKI